MDEINYKNLFKAQFDDWCKKHPMFLAMLRIVENSPWHRESNVLVHTQMVVDEYISLVPAEWTRYDYLGAVACAFHDVGKPKCRIEKHSEARGVYYAYHGHELMSARMFEDFASQAYPMFSDYEIFFISWMIEHHLPWEIKDKNKLRNLVLTTKLFAGQVFCNVLLADQRGRLSDDSAKKLAEVADWINMFQGLYDSTDDINTQIVDDAPVLFVAIGPSGCGKSTMYTYISSSLKEEVLTFSLDALRHEWYGEDYAIAFKASCEDKTFGARANARFIDLLKTNKPVYIDNTNRSAKSRRFYLTEAKRRGYNTVAILFPSTVQSVVDRQATRGDKCVPADVVRQQYYSIQLPSLGEFDIITTSKSNFVT